MTADVIRESKEEESKRYIAAVLWGILLFSVSSPVLCDYFLDSGEIRTELDKMIRVAQRLHLEGVTSRLVFFHHLYLFGVQAFCVLFSGLLMKKVLKETWAVYCGAVFYVTAPARLYICYDLQGMGKALAWSLFPLAVFFLIGAALAKEKKKILQEIGLASVVFAGIGLASKEFLIAVLPGIVMAAVLAGKLWMMVPGFFGAAVVLPKLLLVFLQADGAWTGQEALKFYDLGQLFSSYFYREGQPGLGLALPMGLLLLLWLWVVEQRKGLEKADKIFLAVGILYLFLALDLPVTAWIRRGLLKGGIPVADGATILGVAAFALSVPAGRAVQIVKKSAKDPLRAVGIPLLLILCALGLSVFLCDTYTHAGVPLFIQP